MDPNKLETDPREFLKEHELEGFWADVTDYLQGQRGFIEESEVEFALAHIAPCLYRLFAKGDDVTLKGYARELDGVMQLTAEDVILKRKEGLGQEF